MSPCLLAFAFACGSVETGELETGDSHSQTQRSLRPAKTAISCLLGVAKSGQAVRGLGQKAWPKACLVGPRQNLRNNSSLSPASSSSLGLGQALEGVGWRVSACRSRPRNRTPCNYVLHHHRHWDRLDLQTYAWACAGSLQLGCGTTTTMPCHQPLLCCLPRPCSSSLLICSTIALWLCCRRKAPPPRQ